MTIKKTKSKTSKSVRKTVPVKSFEEHIKPLRELFAREMPTSSPIENTEKIPETIEDPLARDALKTFLSEVESIEPTSYDLRGRFMTQKDTVAARTKKAVSPITKTATTRTTEQTKHAFLAIVHQFLALPEFGEAEMLNLVKDLSLVL